MPLIPVIYIIFMRYHFPFHEFDVLTKGNNYGSNFIFDGVNFVDGFGDDSNVPKFKEPIPNEHTLIVPYSAVVLTEYPALFDFYYTGHQTPSHEVDVEHDDAVSLLTNAASLVGSCPWDSFLYKLEPSFNFNHNELMWKSWEKFNRMEYHEIKYASNLPSLKFLTFICDHK